MTWSVRAAILVSWLVIGAVPARAEVVVSYASQNPEEGAVAASQVASGVTALPLQRGPGVTRASGSTFNTRDWSVDPAIDLDDYLQWGWTSAESPFDLQTLDIRYDRSSTGPAQLEIQMAVNGGQFDTILCDDHVNDAGEDQMGIDLSHFNGVSSATFRLFAFDAERTSGTFDLENFGAGSHAIVVNGVASAVPEPGTLRLIWSLGLGLVAGKLVHRVRRRNNERSKGRC